MEPLVGNPWTAGEVQEGSFLDQIFTFLPSLSPPDYARDKSQS